MRKFLMLLGFILELFHLKAQQPVYSSYPVYTGNDLGLTYTPASSAFRIWSPPATAAEILFYREGEGGSPVQRHALKKGRSGDWFLNVPGDMKGLFYAFRVKIKGSWSQEVPDPYARAVGVNGNRAQVVDLEETNPPGWADDHLPAFTKPNDAVIYELQVRDASMNPASGIQHKGKYTGLTETGTVNREGLSTGLDHMAEMGVTHVHLLPFFDFQSIDEKNEHPPYNWGYDPKNYNTPEGSFSSDPYNGNVRIRELKAMILAMHRKGLRVVMDVVYNHTRETGSSLFNQLVPGYYYRQNADGSFSNATACGNETASERPMFRKFMLESMLYWAKEYHIDGFRVDLMGVHDIETMNLVSEKLHDLNPGILIYGEGWTAGSSPLPDSLRALKANASRLDRVAVFSDDIRDGIKGSVFDITDKGFVSGKPGMEESIKFGVVASCRHPQVNYSLVNYSKAPYSSSPSGTVNYCSCHDNHTLHDKLLLSAPFADDRDLVNMQKLSLAIVLTSQGIPFLQAGCEFMRSKNGVENSFESPDSINAIDWELKTEHRDLVDFVKGLIAMRKEHPTFRLPGTVMMDRDLVFRDNLPEGIIGYTLNGEKAGDSWKRIQVFFNGNSKEQNLVISKGWKVAVTGNAFTKLREEISSISLAPYSCTILYQE